MGSSDIIIVGGGVVGLTNAYFLAQKGWKVAVVDHQTTLKQASWAGAGIIPPGNTQLATNPREWLRAQSSELFPSLSQELESITGINNGYQKCGGLECFETKNILQESLWERELIHFKSKSHSEVPWLENQSGHSYYFPDYAQIRNPWHLRALLKACEVLKVKFFRNTEITGLEINPDTIQGVATRTGVIRGGNFLISAGAWSGKFLPDSGIQASIQPVQGQMILLQTNLPFKEIIISGKRYLVPRGDGKVLAGSTEEMIGFQTKTTSASRTDLLKFAQNMVPELKNASVLDHWAGLRPMCSTQWPLIGQSPRWKNLYWATGHFRSGLQTSPATALFISQLLCGEPTKFAGDCFIHQPAEIPTESPFHS